jgi:hypothetical protein
VHKKYIKWGVYPPAKLVGIKEIRSAYLIVVGWWLGFDRENVVSYGD